MTNKPSNWASLCLHPSRSNKADIDGLLEAEWNKLQLALWVNDAVFVKGSYTWDEIRAAPWLSAAVLM